MDININKLIYILKNKENLNHAFSRLKEKYKEDKENAVPVSYKSRVITGCIIIALFLWLYFDGATEKETFLEVLKIILLIAAVVLFCPFIPIKHVKSEEKDEIETPKAKRNRIIIGIFSSVLGLLALYFMETNRFLCFKETNMCEFQGRHLWEIQFHTNSRLSISDIKQARVQSEIGENSNGERTTSYFVVLDTNSGVKELFTARSSSASTHRERAQKINHFLYTDQDKLKIQESGFWLLFPIPFLIVGALLLSKKISPK